MNKSTKGTPTVFITNDNAKNDPACQMAMASYLERLQREQAHRQAVREGRIPAPQGTWGTWSISDRD
jgi:hypothetical protein